LVFNCEHVLKEENNIFLDDFLFIEGELDLEGLLFADHIGVLEHEVSERHSETSSLLILNDSLDSRGK
jgi:hypothetical protein